MAMSEFCAKFAGGRFRLLGGQRKRLLLDDFPDDTTAYALRAYPQFLVLSAGQLHFDVLEVRLELPPSNSSDLRAHTA